MSFDDEIKDLIESYNSLWSTKLKLVASTEIAGDFTVPNTVSDNKQFTDRLGSNANQQELKDSDLIEHPIIDSMGHSTNILILAYFLTSGEHSFTREAIRDAIKGHKNEMKDIESNFALSRIRDGNTTVNYWIDHLVETGILEKWGYPILFKLNESNQFVENIQHVYPKNIELTSTIGGE